MRAVRIHTRVVDGVYVLYYSLCISCFGVLLCRCVYKISLPRSADSHHALRRVPVSILPGCISFHIKRRKAEPCAILCNTSTQPGYRRARTSWTCTNQKDCVEYLHFANGWVKGGSIQCKCKWLMEWKGGLWKPKTFWRESLHRCPLASSRARCKVGVEGAGATRTAVAARSAEP